MGNQQSGETMREMIPIAHRIDRVDRISPEEFEKKYYNVNKPLIITNMMQDWPSFQKWTKDYMREKIGDRKHNFHYGTESITMKISEYIDKAESYRRETDAQSASNPFPEIPDANEKIPYVRHFGPLSVVDPDLEKDVHPTSLFIDPSKISSWNFLFVGAPGTKTNLHYDCSDNLMAVVWGKKHITLLPPGGEAQTNLSDAEKRKLANSDAHYFDDPSNLRLDFDGNNGNNESSLLMHEHPVFVGAKDLLYSPVNEGEIVFIPTNWYHYIHNIDFSLSITSQTKRIFE
eukprot:TRINITY_DN3356_c0_g1_i1.p1 TRINITY_DN3356_c0_g1~~TRINITY_DN3356_c0_g1_i1.p1  ORF type:complete len:288 (-),score=74.30 TRINITY_DN3356_c0_g1_i1:210-1073(-)